MCLFVLTCIHTAAGVDQYGSPVATNHTNQQPPGMSYDAQHFIVLNYAMLYHFTSVCVLLELLIP